MKKTIRFLMLLATTVVATGQTWGQTSTTVNYIDENGEEKTVDALLLTGNVTTLGTTETDGYGYPIETWYVVKDNVTFSGTSPDDALTINGPTHIILTNGKEMTVSSTGSHGIYGNGYPKNLTIYGQGGTNEGKLTITTTGIDSGNGDNGFEGIDLNGGFLTLNGGALTINSESYCTYAYIIVNGGVFTATSTDNNALNVDYQSVYIYGGKVNVESKKGMGIQSESSGDINIYGGDVTVEGTKGGIAVSSYVFVKGGKLVATATSDPDNGDGIRSGSYVSIVGGQVEATGAGTGKGIYAYTSLNWTNSSDYLKASSYEGTIEIAEGKFFTYDGNSTPLKGYVDGSTAILDGKKLVPASPILVGANYVSYYCDKGNWTLPTGADAYTVSSVTYDATTNDYLVNLGATALGGIPEGVPVILGITTNNDPPLTIYATGANATQAATIESNYASATTLENFVVGDGKKTMLDLIKEATGAPTEAIVDPSEYLAFVLSGGIFHAASFTEATVPQEGKCILILPLWEYMQHENFGTAPSTARSISLGGQTTGIDEAEENPSKGSFTLQRSEWYTLDGRRLEKTPTAKGVYINDGRKLVIK